MPDAKRFGGGGPPPVCEFGYTDKGHDQFTGVSAGAVNMVADIKAIPSDICTVAFALANPTNIMLIGLVEDAFAGTFVLKLDGSVVTLDETESDTIGTVGPFTVKQTKMFAFKVPVAAGNHTAKLVLSAGGGPDSVLNGFLKVYDLVCS